MVHTPTLQNEDSYVSSMLTCVSNMKRLTHIVEMQSQLLQKYELSQFAEIEQMKMEYLHLYEMSLNHFLTIPTPKRKTNAELKKQFLNSFEKLKKALRINKILIVATKNIQGHLLDLHKQNLLEKVSIKSYAKSGYSSKQNSVTTFLTNM